MRYFLFVLILGVILSPSAWAIEGGLNDYVKPMPDIEGLSQDEFKASTYLHEDVPFDQDALAYSIRIPKDWVAKAAADTSNFSVGTKVFGQMGRFVSPASITARSSLSVEAILLEYRLDAQQWLLQHLLKQGLAIQGFEKIDESRAQALYVIVREDVQYAVRVQAVINGKRVILITYTLPTDNWGDERAQQVSVLNSFEIKNPITEEDIEEMQTYRFLDISGFRYPKSWNLKAPPLKTIERMGVQLFSLVKNDALLYKRALNGKMEINIVSGDLVDDLNKEVEAMKQKTHDQGLEIGAFIDYKDEFSASDDFRYQALDVFEARDSRNQLINYELWMATLASDEHFFLFTLLTPSRGEDFFTWARNTNTFMQLIKEFEPILGVAETRPN